MKRVAIGLVAVIAVALAVTFFWIHPMGYTGYVRGDSVCTMEAKQCPDGSYVGRGGPKCEFAPCPSATPKHTASPTPTSRSVVVNGVTITVSAVTQDSRCATDVQCIWAGTVVVRATVKTATGTYPTSLTLGTPVTIGGATVTLTQVTPAPTSKTHLTFSDYRFTFTVSK